MRYLEAGAEGIVNPTPLCEFKRGVGCDSKRSDVLTEGLAEPSPLFELKRGVGLESKEPEALASESVGVTELAEFKSRSDDLDANPEPSPFL